MARRATTTTPDIDAPALQALWDAWNAVDADPELYAALAKIRAALTSGVAHSLRRSAPNFRFTSDYRHGSTPAHELFYALVNTVEVNRKLNERNPQ